MHSCQGALEELAAERSARPCAASFQDSLLCERSRVAEAVVCELFTRRRTQ